MMKVTDLVVKHLEDIGVTDVFMVTGGGAMHLNDSFGKSSKIRCICNHHEQGSAIAAEGYARASGKLAVVNVTTGPGGLNTLNGVFGQWTDSVPVLYISGQVRYDTTTMSVPHLGLRQLGDQEVNIVEVVKPLTKYAVTISQPNDIAKELQKAIYLATEGRPGPVWIDIPMNVQGAIVDEALLENYTPPVILDNDNVQKKLSAVADQMLELLAEAKRPVIVAGHGLRLANVLHAFNEVTELLQVPILGTLNGFDINQAANPLYVGTIGSIGSRAGNFALQNSDLVVYLGTRNNIRQISYNWSSVARAAKKVCVDIDNAELNKPFLKYDLAIHADLKDFVPLLLERVKQYATTPRDWWVRWCQERKLKYSIEQSIVVSDDAKVNPYLFMDLLSKQLSDDGVVVTGDATACICYFQAGKVRAQQRVVWNSGCASMGYDLPASIGAAVASKQDVVCLAGDGSIQMNIQELLTVVHHQLPIKIFYLNNEGYISMKQTQDNFFGRRIGADVGSGVSLPEIEKLANAFGIQYSVIRTNGDIQKGVRDALALVGPAICEVLLPNDYVFAPKLSSERKPDGRLVTKPMEDMFPFLDREEFLSNMIIDAIPE